MTDARVALMLLAVAVGVRPTRAGSSSTCPTVACSSTSGTCVSNSCVCPDTRDNYGECFRVCPAGWQRTKLASGEFWCYKLDTDKRVYATAQAECRADYGHLLVLWDKPDILDAIVADNPTFAQDFGSDIVWIGFNKEYGKLWWDYSVPSPLQDPTLSSLTWGTGEEPWRGKGNCGAINTTVGGTTSSHSLLLRDCLKRYKSICIKEPLIFSSATSIPSSEQAKLISVLRCPTGWQEHQHLDNVCLQYNNQPKLSWENAQTACREQGANLAEPTSWLHNAVATWSIGKIGRSAWIGAVVTAAPNRQLQFANGSAVRGLLGAEIGSLTGSAKRCVRLERFLEHGAPNWRATGCESELGYICQTAATQSVTSEFVSSPRSFRGSYKDGLELRCASEDVDTTVQQIWNKDGTYLTKQSLQQQPVLRRTGVLWCEAWALDQYRRIRSSPAHLSFTDLFTFGLDLNATRLSYRSRIYDEYNLYVNPSSGVPNVNIVNVVRDSLPKKIGNIQMRYDVALTGFSQGSVIIHMAIYAAPEGVQRAIDPDAQAAMENSVKSSLLNRLRAASRDSGNQYYPIFNTQLGVQSSGISIYSNSYCPQERVQDSSGRWLTFPRTDSSRIAISFETCLSDGEALGTRSCQAALPSAVALGARWGPIQLYTRCTNNFTRTQVTPFLENLAGESPTNVGSNPTGYSRSGANLTRVPRDLAYADLVYAALVLSNLAIQEEAYEAPEVLTDMMEIVESMMEANTNDQGRAQRLGRSGSRVKSSMEQYARSMRLSSGQQQRSLFQPKVAMSVLDLSTIDGQFAGFRIAGNLQSNTTFQDGDITRIATVADFQYPGATSGCLFPPSLVEKVQNVSEIAGENSTRVSVIAYSDGRLFQQDDVSSNLAADSNILSIQVGSELSYISDFDQIGITDKIQIVFEPIQGTSTPTCAFWNFTLKDDVTGAVGTWDTRGTNYVGVTNGRVVCESNHLTNFAILLDVASAEISETHQQILGIITKVGLSISIVAMGLSVVTFAIFPQLRQSVSQKVLLNLCIALLAANLLFLIGVERTESFAVCAAISALLQYFILAAFSWMLVEAVHHYLRFVKVLGIYIPKFMLKASLPCWLFPGIFVVAVAAYDYNMFVRTDFCWLQNTALYYFFIPPVAGIILCNMILFILIIRGITNRPKLKTNQSEKKLAIIQIRASLATLVLLGVTWIFGFLALDLATLPMQYLFCIFNAFQGLFIFILHLAREKTVQRQWIRCCCPKRYREEKFGRTTSGFTSSRQRTTETETGNNTPVTSRNNLAQSADEADNEVPQPELTSSANSLAPSAARNSESTTRYRTRSNQGNESRAASAPGTS